MGSLGITAVRTIGVLVALASAATGAAAATTYTYRNGVNGYTGSVDVAINNQYAQYNGGNGITNVSSSQMSAYNTTGTDAYSVRYLLRFGNLSIPAGSQVISASLSLTADAFISGGSMTGYYLKNAWSPASSALGWLQRDSGLDWGGAGASAAGIDTVPGKSFALPALAPVGAQTLNMALDPSVVQSWINTPSTNQGIMIVNNNSGEVVRFTSTYGTQNQRPQLTIVVANSVGVQISVSPTTVTMAPGGTQTFGATVIGSTNTAVTWSATGGTITQAGVYTAGAVAGIYKVKAIPAADPTKSASAAVTVGTPVSVSISPTSASVGVGQTRQFAATVTGTTNTAVTWSATGGTITSGGLFTAGSSAGTFAVTARSAADTSKTGVSSVTVTQAVSVSITPTSATVQAGQTQQFTAAVAGSGNASVTWEATGGTVSSAGLFTAGQNNGNFTVRARSVADNTKSAAASVTVSGGTSLPPVPRQSDGAYVVIQSPVSGMHFTAPGTFRIFADPYVINSPDPDGHTVTFLVNGQVVGSYTGSASQNGYYAFTVNNLAAGTYSLTAQIPSPNGTVTSAPVTIYVDPPAVTSGPVFDLTSDIVLSGTQVANYEGTQANPCTINGNGYQIRSAAGFVGSLKIANCNVRNLGTASAQSLAVEVAGSGSIQLLNNRFELFGSISVGADNQAQIIVRGNEFRENTLVPVGSQPEDASTLTVPVFIARGNSTAQKYFQGNNVGLSTVVFLNTRNWLIGGSVDAESNVLMGVRCGFRISGSLNMVLRGNYSQHNYPHRFSQGENFQLNGDGFLVEHNVIRSSSWPVRGMGGELRYNLIDSSGNSDQVLQSPMSNTKIHHNIFTATVSQTLYSPAAGVSLSYAVDGIQFHNNVMDGGGTFMGFYGSPMSIVSGAFLGSLRNNVFYNYALSSNQPVVTGAPFEGTTTATSRLRYADYNAFYNPAAPNQNNYGVGVLGVSAGAAGFALHDLGGFNGHVNPNFAQPTAIPFPFAPEAIWSRTKKVSDVLAQYRAMYTPATGSPLLGAGDPQDGTGGNIGVVGNNEPSDLFGKFGTGAATPAPPVISLFSAASASIQAGQSVGLNWSVTGADTLNIDPVPGPVTGTSATVTPNVDTTFTLTAANAGGFSTAQVTVTVIGGQPVSITVAPTSATIAVNSTRQFSASVSGTTNTAVTWTASAGSISSSGLYTAPAATGTYTVTARSVQDPTKTATANVTVTPPQPISVTITPPSALVYPNGTQQFTATVSNAANTSVIWNATGGSVSSTGLFTADAATGSFTVTATSVQDPSKFASVSIAVTAPNTTAHPRIILDSAQLSILRSRMQSSAATWVSLKATCDAYAGPGTVYLPSSATKYPSAPNVGEGYQGGGYMEPLLSLGLCYQTMLASNPTLAAQYGAKGVAILMGMSDPAGWVVDGTQIWYRDVGYGIRNFGFGLGLGYDWFYPLLSATQKTQIVTALRNWLEGYETNGFEHGHPQGNYFAGYYVSKAMAGLAVEGDDPLGDAWWADWYNNRHMGMVVPSYGLNLAGGGWSEGIAQYGILSMINMSLPALAVKTAKGIDLINAPQPYRYPLDNAQFMLHFTWPSRDMTDDRGELYNTESTTIWPGTVGIHLYRYLSGYLTMMNDPLAPVFHRYTRDVKTALDAMNYGSSVRWIDFLFWDENAPEADYSAQPASYLAPGMGAVSARSDWSAGATFMSFVSGPFVNYPGATHEHLDKGSPAFQRARNPLLVNPTAWLTHEPNGSPGWTATFDDLLGNSSLGEFYGNRRMYNTFQVRKTDAAGKSTVTYGQWQAQRSDGARTQVSRFEDGGSYVLSVGRYLEDMYRPLGTMCGGLSPVSAWSRQILYLRPSQFVVYDRTGICDTSLDQYMAFHFPANPVEVGTATAGVRRFDVTTASFAGSMTTVLPANAAVATTDQVSANPILLNKMWRSEVRPTDTVSANRQWLTVFDLAGSPAQVAAAAPLTVISGAATGTVLQGSAGNSVAVFGTAPVGTAISGTLAYTSPAMAARHVITDLAPGSGYTVSVAVVGGNHSVTVTPGGSTAASANGVLTFTVTMGGAVQP